MTSPFRFQRTVKSSFVLFVVATVTLLGFALRAHRLVDVPPRWDEGWSIAHASLNVLDLFTITAADVHPPLFYMLLGFWQWLVGTNLFTARYLAVLMSLPALPLTFAVARAWVNHHGASGLVRIPVLATVLMAWLPLTVYYSAVVRMYALAPAFVLLACWAGIRLATAQPRHDSKQTDTPWQRFKHVVPWSIVLAFVVGAAGAMYTLYHSVWVLAALGIYLLALIGSNRALLATRLRNLSVAVGLAVLTFSPWAIYAIPQLAGRAAAETGNTAQQYSLEYFIQQGITGLTMSYQAGWLGQWVLALIIFAGLASWFISTGAFTIARLGLRAREKLIEVSHLALPVIGIVLTLVGVAMAARNWAFNARMVICAAPLLAMWLAWSLDQWMRHSRALAGSACILMMAAYFTTSVDFVYQKSLEVFDPYNPHTYAQHLAEKARSTDEVFFNVLSPAGFYALDRKPESPNWSYALTWDPVIEPSDRWKERIEQAASTHERVWVVLYRGLTGANGDLRGWMDSNWYPADAEWGEEQVFYGLYGMYLQPLQKVNIISTHWRLPDGFDLELMHAESVASLHAGAVVPVGLIWQAHSALKHNFKIFVHAFDENGTLIAQHDAQPLNDLRPMETLPVNTPVDDHHGLALPPAFTGKLRIVLGLYDAQSGQRLPDENGKEEYELGEVLITP